MNAESVPNRCPQCGGTVPPDAPQGLCPRCVLARAATPTEAGAKSGSRLTPPPLAAVTAAFPQFEILELIGIGGMGVVYKARQPKLDRVVALKLLPQSPGADPAFAERFHREARFLARLTHPHIVSVFDFGESGGFCYLLMEFVDGVNLRQAMQAGRFSPAQALAIVPDICSALQYAHDQGVLHRDIKPENILLDAQGKVKIADFGIAKLVGDPGDPQSGLTLTQSGARLGTPHYMAPEQIEKPSDVDHRADIYSLGVVFYELLTGELPLGRFAAPSAKAALDARVDDIVMRALAKERELRQQSAGEVKSQVETVAANPRAPAADAAASAIQAAKDAELAARMVATAWSADYEYKSPRTLFGRPLVHVAFGRDPATGQMRVARGFVAMGQKAVGVIAIGGYARGVVALGGIAVGVVACGGLGMGLLAFAGLALGLFSLGGLSVGLLLAIGGGAIGLNAAGGFAMGKFAAGGLGLGKAVWDARRHDEAAHWLLELIQSRRMVGALVALSVAAGVIPTVISAWVQWHRIRHGAAAGTGGNQPSPTRIPTPWPHWLLWVLLAMVALPTSVFVASLFRPVLHPGILGFFGMFAAATVTLATGAGLLWVFLRNRPSAARPDGTGMLQHRSQLGGLLLFAILCTAIIPMLYQMQRRPSVPYLIQPATLSGPNSFDAQLIRTERTATSSQVRLRWELHSAGPMTVRIGFRDITREVAVPGSGSGLSGIPVTILAEPQGANRSRLTVSCADGGPDQTIRLFLDGDPYALLTRGNDYVSGDLPLRFNTRVWLALFASDQVSLEIRPSESASQPSTNRLAKAETHASDALPQGDPTAELELKFARNRLAEMKKWAEVGMVAPHGQEVLDAEVAVAEAEAKLRNDPRIAAEARLNRATQLLTIAQRMREVGKATTADVEAAQLEEARARAKLEGLDGRAAPSLNDGESWPASDGPQNLLRAFTLGTRGDHAGALEALRLALKDATPATTNRWVFRRGFSAYVFDGRLDQRITALMVQEAAHSATAATLREIQAAGTLIWPADGTLDLYEVWVDHFVPGRADQDTDKVHVPLWLLRAMQLGEARSVTVTHEHKESGKPPLSNIVTGDWLNPR